MLQVVKKAIDLCSLAVGLDDRCRSLLTVLILFYSNISASSNDDNDESALQKFIIQIDV